jgi:hypothetical protein
MIDQKNKPSQDQKPDEAQFRAVVKRLLDTPPPMHKTGKRPATKRAPGRSKRRVGKDQN